MPKYISYDDWKDIKFKPLGDIWKFGNIIAMSDDRDTNTFIIGKKGIPVVNPDDSGSGYLTIPLEITQHLNNAFKFYKSVLLDKNQPSIIMHIRPNDNYLINCYGEALPENYMVSLFYGWGKFENVKIECNGRTEEFDLDTPIKDIKKHFRLLRNKKM